MRDIEDTSAEKYDTGYDMTNNLHVYNCYKAPDAVRDVVVSEHRRDIE